MGARFMEAEEEAVAQRFICGLKTYHYLQEK